MIEACKPQKVLELLECTGRGSLCTASSFWGSMSTPWGEMMKPKNVSFEAGVDGWQGMMVLCGDVIMPIIVDAEVECAILLLNKEEPHVRRGRGGLGGTLT